MSENQPSFSLQKNDFFNKNKKAKSVLTIVALVLVVFLISLTLNFFVGADPPANLTGYVKYSNNTSIVNYSLNLMLGMGQGNQTNTTSGGFYNFTNFAEGLYSLEDQTNPSQEYNPHSPMGISISNWSHPNNLINVSGDTRLNLTIYNITMYTNASNLNQTNYSNGDVLTVQINVTNNEAGSINFTYYLEAGFGDNSARENVTISSGATESRILNYAIPTNNTNSNLEVRAGVDIDYNQSYTHGNVIIELEKLDRRYVNVNIPDIEIHLISPLDDNLTSNNNISFAYNISRVDMTVYSWNCTLVLNSEDNETDPNSPILISGSSPYYNGTINVTLDDGQYNWTINCTEFVEGNISFVAEEVWNLTIYTPPVNLTVVKYLENSTVNCSSVIPFIINVTNNENYNLTNITVNDTLGQSTGFFFQNSVPMPTVFVPDNYVYWTISNLGPGETYTIRPNFTSSGTGNKTNTIRITNATGAWLMNSSGNVTLVGNCSEEGGELTVNLTSPSDGYNFSSAPVTFNFTVMGMGMSVNCSLWGNFTGAWGLNQTGYNFTIGENNSNNSFNLSSLNNGSYIWNVNCSSNFSGNSSWAQSNRTFSVGTWNSAPYVLLDSLAYYGNPLPYVNVSGEMMLFAGDIVEIKGDANDSDFANWTISLRNSSGIINSSLCFNTSAVGGTFCSWNTSEYCLGECENYTLILNASDSSNHTNSTFLENITIDNYPPSMGGVNTITVLGMPPSWTGDVNISDNYLQKVDGLILDENNSLVVEQDYLCNKTQGNCAFPGNGEFNYSWYWDSYLLNGNKVPVVWGGFFTDYPDDFLAVVPGCFAQNGISYDCGGLCANQSICFTYKWMLVYNMTITSENRTFLGLTNAQLCSSEGCLVNTTIIQNGTSKFKPQFETLDLSTVEWSFENITNITLYNVNDAHNLNLSFESPEPGNYTLVFMAQDYFWITINYATEYLNLSESSGLNAELNDVANNMGFVSGIVNITGYVNGTNLTNWTVGISNLTGMVNSSLCSGNSSINGTLCSWYTSQYCLGECANYTVRLNALDSLGGNISSSRDNLIIDNHAPNISILLINTSNSNEVFARANITDGYLYEVRAYVFNSTNKTIMEWGRFCGQNQNDSCQEILQGTFNRTWGKRIYQLNNFVLSVSNKWDFFNGSGGSAIIVPGCFAQNGTNYDCGGVCSNLSLCSTYRWWLAYNDSIDGNKTLMGISNDMLCVNGCQFNNSAINNGTSKFMIQIDKYNFSSGGWSYENITNITLYGIGNSSNLDITSSNIDEGNFSFAFEAIDRAGWGSLSSQSFNLTAPQQENTNFSLSHTSLNPGTPNLGDTIRFLINVTNTGSENISNLTITDDFDVNYNYTNASVIPNTINYTNYTLSWNNLSVNLSQNQSYLLYANFSANLTVHNAFNTVYLTVYYSSGGSSTSSNSLNFDIRENITPNITFVDATTSGEGNYSRSSIWANVSVNDASEISSVTIFLFNSTGLYNSSTNNSFNGPSGYFFVNFTSLPEGTYWLNATVNDTWGNPNSTGIRVITLDRTAPNVYWMSPTSTNYTNNSILINITFGLGTSSIWWNNGTDNLSYITAVVYNFSQGSHTIITYANDTAGNIGSSSVTFFVDSIVPFVDFGSGTETSGTTVNRQEIIINATASDSGSGLKNVTIYLYNSSGLVSSSNSTSSPLFWNTTSLGDGIYYFNATAYDHLGNFNYTGTRNVTVSAVAPMITIVAPLNQTYTSTTIVFNVSLSEPGSWCGLSLDGTGNKSMTVAGNFANYTNSSMTQGSHNVTFYCNDTDGNMNLTSVRYFFIDSVAPTYSNNLTSPASPANYSPSQSYQFNITWNDLNNISTATLIFNGSNYTMNHSGNNYTYTFSSLAAGNYSYYFWANDTFGNSNQTSSINYSVNRINPTITVLLNGVASNLVIAYPNQVNASGSTIGGTLTIYRNDTQINNGINYTLGVNYYRFDFNVTGNENYSSSSASLFANVTRANSDVTLYLNNSQGNTSIELGDSIWINATNTSQGNIYLYKNGTLINNGTSPSNYTSFNSITMWDITAAYPATQNYSSSSETWWVNVTDTTTPTITLPVYTNETPKKNTSILTLNISITDLSTIQSPCFIDVNGTNQTIAYSGGWCNGTVSLLGMFEGDKVITIYGNDSSGNMGFDNSYVVFVDSTAPTITLPTYVNATKKKNTDNLTFNISVFDLGVGASYCAINVNGTNQTLAVSDEWCNGTVSLTGLSNGNKTIYAYTNDTLGNIGLNSNYVVWIDATSPIAYQGTNPIENYNDTDGNVTFDLKCSDNADVSYIQLWTNVTGNWSANYSNAGYTNNTWLNITVNGILDGQNIKWAVYCNDTAGNMNMTANRTFRVDTTAPHITIFSPGNTSYFTVQNITVNFTATDLTHVDSLWYNDTINASNISSNNGTYSLTNGSYTFIFYANDSFNHLASKGITFTVEELGENQTILNESDPTVGENTTEIILPQNQSLSTVAIPSSRAEDDLITLNLGQRVDSDGNLSFGADLNLSRVGSSANYTAEIPSDVVISGGSGWTGEFILPTVKSTSGLSAPSITGYTTTLEKIITVGSSIELNFSSPVKLVIGGMGGKRAAWARGPGFSNIPTICNSTTVPSLNSSVRECYNNTGTDLVIWTLHFTDFAAYSYTTIVENPPGGGSPGGGGGGGAIATNETKQNPTYHPLPDINQSKTCSSGYVLKDGECVEVETEKNIAGVASWAWVVILVIVVALFLYMIIASRTKKRIY